MNIETLTWIVGILISIVGAGASLIGKFILDAIKDHIKAVKENTIALAVLDKEIKNIMKNSDQIPELTKDLNNYFQRLKVLESKMGEQT